MPNEQFFSYLMARTSYVEQDNDDCIVLDQHAWLDIYSARSLTQQSTGQPG
jgi:hypothetical protein